ncbi:hypothetical protein MTR_4g064360 [Medicago truncatula]|uniref:Uncharacterized protein n=1 Tax=Medicago truncatula TaxID=3880 RepID=G7JUV5_MEDTR|nr:hypothetical protein MTR_4g064360 [Medicago truncatula]
MAFQVSPFDVCLSICGEFSAMGESLTEQCRVEVKGLRVMNFFSWRRNNDGIQGISIG